MSVCLYVHCGGYWVIDSFVGTKISNNWSIRGDKEPSLKVPSDSPCDRIFRKQVFYLVVLFEDIIGISKILSNSVSNCTLSTTFPLIWRSFSFTPYTQLCFHNLLTSESNYQSHKKLRPATTKPVGCRIL